MNPFEATVGLRNSKTTSDVGRFACGCLTYSFYFHKLCQIALWGGWCLRRDESYLVTTSSFSHSNRSSRSSEEVDQGDGQVRLCDQNRPLLHPTLDTQDGSTLVVSCEPIKMISFKIDVKKIWNVNWPCLSWIQFVEHVPSVITGWIQGRPVVE